MLLELQGEAAAFLHDLHRRAWERIGNRFVQQIAVADFHDGAPCRRQVAAVVGEHRRARAHLRHPGRRGSIAAHRVVEAPAAHLLAQHQRFRGTLGIGAREHAVERWQMAFDDLPGAAFVACAHHAAPTINHGAAVVPERAVPDGFALDLRVLAEHRARHRRRQAVVDGVAEVVASEAQPQAHGFAPRAALHRMVATLDGARELLRPGPKRRLQPAFAGQSLDGVAEGGLREQAQGAMQIRLAAAVGAGDDVQPPQRHHQVAQRAVAGDRQRPQHASAPSARAALLRLSSRSCWPRRAGRVSPCGSWAAGSARRRSPWRCPAHRSAAKSAAQARSDRRFWRS